MAIVGNRYYNDPNIGAAFANLAAAFAPPSGSDLAGYANAGATKEKAQRLAQLFQRAQDPNFNQSAFDRMGQATGQWTPSTGYYGVNTTAETVRRGQDVQARSALDVAKMNNQGEMDRQLAEPLLVNAGQTAYLPKQTQQGTGLGSTLSGQVNLNQGERAYLPGGGMFEGAPKPLSESEQKAQILAGLPESQQVAAAMGDTPIEQIIMNGQPVNAYRTDAVGQSPVLSETDQKGAMLAGLPPEMQRAIMLGDIPTTTVIDEAGNPKIMLRPNAEGQTPVLSEADMKGLVFGQLPQEQQTNAVLSDVPVETVQGDNGPQIVTRADAVGKTPVDTTGQPKTQNYKQPDGSVGTARFEGGKWLDTTTGQEIQQGSIMFSTSLQGSGEDVGIGATTANITAANKLQAEVTDGQALLMEMRDLVNQNPAASGAAGNVLSFGQDLMQTAREFGQAFGDNPDAKVTSEQFQSFVNQYMPEVGSGYNPVYHKVRALLLELAYSNAKLNDPSGDVSRIALQRELDALGQGLFANDQSLLATLDVYESRLLRAQNKVDALRDPAAARERALTPAPDTGGDDLTGVSDDELLKMLGG